MPNPLARLLAALGVALCAALASCAPGDEPISPEAPSPPSAPSFKLSGVVYEHTPSGPQPLANVKLRVWVRASILMTVSSDASGRYELTGVPGSHELYIEPAPESGFFSPCPAGSNWLRTDEVIDVHVVSGAVLSSSGTPRTMPRSEIWTSGVVFESTSLGRRPVAGARVDFAGDGSEGGKTSSTLTDQRGAYLVCTAPPGVGTDSRIPVRASRAGYLSGTGYAVGGWDYDGIDIELVRP